MRTMIPMIYPLYITSLSFLCVVHVHTLSASARRLRTVGVARVCRCTAVLHAADRSSPFVTHARYRVSIPQPELSDLCAHAHWTAPAPAPAPDHPQSCRGICLHVYVTGSLRRSIQHLHSSHLSHMCTIAGSRYHNTSEFCRAALSTSTARSAP